LTDFPSAVGRINATSHRKTRVALLCRVGNEQADPKEYLDKENVGAKDAEFEVAEARNIHIERATAAAHTVNQCWGRLVQAVRKQPGATRLKYSRSTMEAVQLAIDNALSTGYWLAKAEFDPHLGEVSYGRKRKEAAREAGKNNTKARDYADTIWRMAFLEAAKKVRAKHDHYGHDALINAIGTHLNGYKLPSYATRLQLLKRWERSGELKRSTRNPLTRGKANSPP